MSLNKVVYLTSFMSGCRVLDIWVVCQYIGWMYSNIFIQYLFYFSLFRFLFYDNIVTIFWYRDFVNLLMWLVQVNAPWTRWIAMFDPVKTASNALVMWVGGPGALMMESLSNTTIAQNVQQLLLQFTGEPVIPLATSVVRYTWNDTSIPSGKCGFFLGFQRELVFQSENPGNVLVLLRCCGTAGRIFRYPRDSRVDQDFG